MAIRTKTRRRLWLLLLVGLLSCLVAGGGYFLRQRQIARRLLTDRNAGYAAFAVGDHLTALNKIGPYLGRNQNDGEALLKYAIARSKVEQPNGKHIFAAITVLRQLLEIDPENVEGRQYLLDAYLSIGFNTEIISATEERADPISLRARAIALAKTDRAGKAEEVSTAYNKLKPSDLEMQIFTCMRMRDRKVADADIIAWATQLQQSHPDDPRFELLVGFVLGLANERSEALRWTRMAAARTLDEPGLIQAVVDQLDQLGQNDEAMEVLQKAARLHGDSSFQRRVVSRLYQSGRFADVLIRTEELEANPNIADIDLLAHRAMALIELRREADARHLIDLLASRKSDVAALGWADMLASINVLSIDEKRVIIACRELLKTRPNNPYSHLYLGDSLARLGEGDAAIREWAAALRVANLWARPLARVLSATVALGRIADSRELMVRVAGLSHDDAESLAILAVAKAATGEAGAGDSVPSDLIQLIDRVQKLRPGEHLTLALKVQVLAAANRRQEARDIVIAALAPAHPASKKALLELARASEASNLELESDCFDRCQAAYGRTIDLVIARCAKLIRAGRRDEAVKTFEASLANEGARGDLAWQLGFARVLDVVGDPRAAKQLASVADANVDDPAVQYAVLVSQSAQGDHELLGRVINRIESLIGEDGISWRLADAKLILQVATTKVDKRERDIELIKATTVLNEITRRYPNFVQAQLMLSECLFRLNRKDAASERLATAIRLSPGSLLPVLHQASLLQSMGDFARAEPYLEQAEQILKQQSTAPTTTPVIPNTQPTDGRRDAPNAIDRIAANTQSVQEAWRTLASLRAAAGQSDKAITILRSLNMGDPVGDLRLATMLGRSGELTDETSRQLLEQRTPAAIGIVAEYYVSTGRLSEADTVIGMLDRLDAPISDRELAHGLYLLRRGQTNQAIEHLRSACAASPGNYDTWRILISSMLFDGQIEQAIASATKASDAMPDGAVRFKIIIDNAQLLRAVANMPLAWRLLPTLANDLEQQENVRAFLSALQRSQVNKITLRQLAVELKGLADKTPSLWPMQDVVIEILAKLGRHDDAAPIAVRSMQLAPANPAPARRSAEMLAAAGHWEEVIRVTQEWKRRVGRHAAAPDQMLASAYLATGNFAEATRLLEPYREQAKRDPASWTGFCELYAEALIGSGRVTDAREFLEPMLRTGPLLRGAWMTVGVSAVKDAKVASQWIQRVATEIPTNSIDERIQLALSWLTLAQRNATSEDSAAADEALRNVSNLASSTKDVKASQWLGIGLLKEMANDSAGAEAAYRKCLMLESEPVAQNNLAMIIARRKGAITDAIDLATRAVADADHPGHVDFLDTLALLREQAGQFDLAEMAIKDAVRLNPQHLSARADLVQILLSAGKIRESRQALEELEMIVRGVRKPDPKLTSQLQRLSLQLQKAAANTN